jgi:dihydroxyacid dehydratase/phosphogluconate dehydratase
MHRSHGHCMTMGTASTMASMVEALGIGLPATPRFPAVDGAPQRARAHGRPAHRRHGHEDLKHVQDPDARGLRERHPHNWPPSAARPTR